MVKLYDVVKVDEFNKVKVIAREKTEANAEAIVGMAIMRQDEDDEGFFAEVPAGSYQDGDLWRF